MPDPWIINASAGAPAYDAAELRRLFAVDLQYGGRTLGGRPGVRPGGNALETSIAGSTITVRAGCAVVDPALSTSQGPYRVVLPADETPGPLTAAHATLPRKDLTVLRVYDHDEDASGMRLARSEYIAGVENASPAEPNVPAGAFRLATIDVPSVASGNPPVVTNNFPLTAAAGGVVPVRNQAERDLISAFDGMACYRRDRDWTEVHDGTAWRVLGPAVCSSVADLSAVTHPYTGQQVTVLLAPYPAVYRWTGSAWVDFSGAHGIVGGRWISGTNNLGAAVTNTEVSPTNMDSGAVGLAPNRLYRVRTRFKCVPTADGNGFLCQIREDAAAGTGGTMIGQDEFIVATSQQGNGLSRTFDGYYETSSSPITRVFTFTANRFQGAGSAQFVGGGSSLQNRVGVWVYDEGPAGLVTTTAS